MSTSRIQALPAEVITQMKSALIINRLSDVVLGLLRNSLDANATKIAISVNFCRGDCTVEDNGVGIPWEEFGEQGKLGHPYCSSKLNSPNTYGTHGNFLSSLAALSLLKITSCDGTDAPESSILLHHSKRINPVSAEYDKISPTLQEQGTKVVVRNLFGNMPVRVKHRASLEETGDNEMEWRSMILSMASLILAWNKPVSIRLHGENPNHRINIVERQARHQIQDATAERSNANFDRLLVLNILTQMSLVEPESRLNFVPISGATKAFKVKGMISTEPMPTKQKQFISFGMEPLSRNGNHNELFETVNRAFANSDFGANLYHSDINDDNRVRRSKDRCSDKDRTTNIKLREQKKGIDRWPIFYFRIAAGAHDNVSNWAREADAEAGSMLGDVVDVLEAMAVQWLASQQFRPHNSRNRSENSRSSVQKRHLPPETASTHDSTSKSGNDVSLVASNAKSFDSPRKRKRPQTEPYRDHSSTSTYNSQPFPILLRPKTAGVPRTQCLDTWSRVKSSAKLSPLTSQKSNVGPKDLSFEAQSDTIASYSQENVTKMDPSTVEDGANDEELEWQDSVTKVIHLVNARSGAILPNYETLQVDKSKQDNYNTARTNDQRHSHATSRTGWITDFLKTWDNPVFRPSESKIPQIMYDIPTDEGRTAGQPIQDHWHHNCAPDIGAFEHVALRPSNLSIAGLKNAEIVSQLDAKFILVKVPVFSAIRKSDGANKTQRTTLALIDQHAGDERCKVESLFEEICSIADNPKAPSRRSVQGQGTPLTTSLQKPIVFTSSTEECGLLQRHASVFARWGISYEMISVEHTTNTTANNTQRVRIRTLPTCIAQRCTAEPRILIELIRAEAWKRDEALSSNGPSRSETGGGEAHGWLRRIGDCPQGVIAMLNSRACRSAIMFNDTLSNTECEALISKLANTAFPFQCAHGRPSMVPLLEIGDDESANGIGLEGIAPQHPEGTWNKEEDSFVEKFKLWQARMAMQDNNATQ